MGFFKPKLYDSNGLEVIKPNEEPKINDFKIPYNLILQPLITCGEIMLDVFPILRTTQKILIYARKQYERRIR